MLNLNHLDIDVDFALGEHNTHICNQVNLKLSENIDNTTMEYTSNELIKQFLQLTNDESGKVVDNSVEKIICSKNDELKKINKRFQEFVDLKSKSDFDNETYKGYLLETEKKNKHKKDKIHNFFKRVESVFSYDTFGDKKYSKYILTENLKIRTCVYCNRMYATTQYKSDGTNLMNPQLDHWLPQSKYPLLQVSFFNLIPSCEICNSRIKKVKEFKEDEHVHPYDDSYEDIKFTYFFDKELDDLKVVFENDGITVNKVRDTFEYLYVDEMYNAHIPELKDLIKIKEVYGDTYLKKLQESFPDIAISNQDRFRLAFGVELDSRKFHLYPLSKFKNDILKELGLIK